MYGCTSIDGVMLRTRDKKFTPNEVILFDTHAEVILYNVKNIECARALVSLDKVDIIKKYAWSAYLRDRSCYAMTRVNGKTTKMHNLLFSPPDGMICDHINRNGLDNRNENIRFATHQENLFNAGPKKNNKSGYQGVYWNPANKNWRSRIKVNGKPIELGSFINLYDAIAARKAAEVKYFGEFAPADVN